MSEKLRKIAKRARSDFFYLATEILGYKDLRDVPHREVCEKLKSQGRRKKLFLLPRGSFKSSLITVAGAIEAMIQNPNIRILISCETQNNARKYASEIRGHIEGNPKFRAIFGDWVSEDRAWRDDEFTINRRTKVLKEPTVKAASLEKMTVTGLHFDLIICDDVVSRLNVNTTEQIEKTIDHYKLLLSVLDPQPDKQIWVVGTRYSVHDLYGWITDPEGTELDQFDVCIKQAIDEDGNLLLPDRLTHAFLEEQRKTQGNYIFSCQYLNNPVASENQTFQPQWIKWYDKPPKDLIYFMTVDPAISLRDSADYTAIIVNGVDWRHDYYIQEVIQKRMEPSETIDTIFRLAEKYSPLMCLGMERFALEKLLKIALLEAMDKRRLAIPIKEIETDTRVSKEVRIRSLQPKFQNGQIYLRKEHQALYNQIVMHPQVKYDDLLDALKSQLAITFPATKINEGEESNYSGLPYKDRKMWENVEKIVRRRVRVTSSYEV